MTQLFDLLNRIREIAGREKHLQCLVRCGRGGAGTRQRICDYVREKDSLWSDALCLLDLYNAPDNVVYICRQHFYARDTWLCISAKLYGYMAYNHMMAKRELEAWVKRNGGLNLREYRACGRGLQNGHGGS